MNIMKEQMNNEVQHDKANQKFFINHNGSESHLEYNLRGKETIEFVSTFVPENFRNSGIASKLVQEGLNYARKKNLKVIPICSFTRSFIKSHDEYQDLVR